METSISILARQKAVARPLPANAGDAVRRSTEARQRSGTHPERTCQARMRSKRKERMKLRRETPLASAPGDEPSSDLAVPLSQWSDGTIAQKYTMKASRGVQRRRRSGEKWKPRGVEGKRVTKGELGEPHLTSLKTRDPVVANRLGTTLSVTSGSCTAQWSRWF